MVGHNRVYAVKHVSNVAIPDSVVPGPLLELINILTLSLPLLTTNLYMNTCHNTCHNNSLVSFHLGLFIPVST